MLDDRTLALGRRLLGSLILGLLCTAAPRAQAEDAAAVQVAALEGPALRLTPAVAPPGEVSGLFGAARVAAGKFLVQRQWAAIATADPRVVFSDRCRLDERLCNSRVWRAWSRVAAHRDEGITERALQRLNREVNAAIRYAADRLTYGVESYWATPAETARAGAGDCKDYATVKFSMLAALGWPLERMEVVVVRERARNLGHAILSVRLGDTAYILDSLTDQVLPETEVTGYQPLYALAAQGSWLFGERKPVRVARQAPLPGAPELRGTIF